MYANMSEMTRDRTRPAKQPAEATYLEAMRRRDRSYDGVFVYAVRTTGVYCKPSCASRPARPENLSYHATPAAAEAAGFRACKRCRPDKQLADLHQSAVERACRMIRASEEPLSLATLAKAVGMSPYHFHRVFKKVAGVTPKAFAAANRAERANKELRSASTVTEAIYAAGFNSSSRFYENANARLGMTPGQLRRGGDGITIRFAIGTCSLGTILVAGAMALGVIVWKGRLKQTLLNIARLLAAVFSLHAPGAEVSLDNPESTKIPFGVAVAVAVVFYGIAAAIGKA